MTANRYLPAAQSAAQAIPCILADQGLDPLLISRFVLTDTERGDAWLFVVMDDSVMDFLSSYAAPSLLSHLSSALRGHIEAIKYYMDSRGLDRRDLERYIGPSGRVSEVLNRKRPLTLAMIRKLNAGLGIPAEVLIQRSKS